MYCEICGKQADKTSLVSIEKAKLRVCPNCSHYGVEVPEYIPASKPRIIVLNDLSNISLKEDIGEQLVKLRQQKNLTHEELAKQLNEQVSYIKKVESGKMRPTEKLARKLKTSFGINTIESEEK